MRELSPAVQAALKAMHKAEAKVEARKLTLTSAREAKAKLVPKRKPLLPPPARKLSQDSDRWVYDGLVLVVTRLTCACGEMHEVPGSKLLLRRRDKRTGAIWEAAEGATCELPPLPRHRRVHEAKCEACPKCYAGLANLEHITCLLPLVEHPVPIYDTPSAYAAAQAIAKMRRGKEIPEAEAPEKISWEDL